MGEFQDRVQLLEKRKRLSAVRRETLRKIKFLRNKAVIEPHDVYHLTRSFFKTFLEKPYEFTINELREELKHVYISHSIRQNINEILTALEGMEYKDVRYTHEQLVAVLDLLHVIVQALVKVHTSTPSLFTKISMFFTKEIEPDVIIAELPVIEDDNLVHVRMHTLVEKCYLALDKKSIPRAKAAYEALLAEYGTLEDEKASYYQLIEQTYRDMMNRLG